MILELSDVESLLKGKGQTYTDEILRTGFMDDAGIKIEYLPSNKALITATSGELKTSIFCEQEMRLPWEESAQMITENGLAEILFEADSFAKSIHDDDNAILYTLANDFSESYRESPEQKDFSVNAARLGLYFRENKQSGIAVIELKPELGLPGLFYYYSFRIINQNDITYL